MGRMQSSREIAKKWFDSRRPTLGIVVWIDAAREVLIVDSMIEIEWSY